MSKFNTEFEFAKPPQPMTTLLKEGVTEHALRGSAWQRTSRGLYLPGADTSSTTQRIVSAAALVPEGGAIGGWASAYAHGADHLDGLDGARRPLQVTLCLPVGVHRSDTSDVHYVRQSLAKGDIVEVAGMRFTSPVRTALDLARWAPSLPEAVVAVDAMLGAGLPRDTLLRAAAALRRQRGAKQARQAAQLGRTGVRSPGESRLRVAYVVDLITVDPLVNPTLLDLDGRVLAMPDLLDEEAGLVLEYDGASWVGSTREAGHRDHDQHREDNAREELLERAKLLVVRAGRADLGRHRAQLRHRMRTARADGLARDRRHDRWLVQR